MSDKENIKKQQEYNSLLGLTQSMLGKIDSSMENTLKASDNRNKKLKEQISLTREIIKSVQTEEDLIKASNLLRENGKNISKQHFGVNKELSKQFIAQNATLSAVLGKHIDSKKTLEQVAKVVGGVSDKFDGVVDSIQGGLYEIPIIGETLANAFQPMADKTKKMFNIVSKQFLSGFTKSFNSVENIGLSSSKRLTAGIGGGFRAAATAASRFASMLGGIGIAILVIAAGLALGFKRFQELDEAAKDFRENTGLLVSQTRGMQENIKSTSVEFANLGVSASDVAKAASEFVNEFAGIEKPSENALGSMVMLNKNFGIGIQEATKLNKVFQNIGGLSADQSQYLIGQTAELAKMSGVAPQKVIKDMADSSEYAYKYFQGSPKELAKAAVQAAKLGTSIAEAGKSADNLLDFESSITKELEAGAMLGVNLNLSQARYLAANGKVLESQQAVFDQVEKVGDLTKLTVFQQKALSDATGMEFSSLVNQQRIRERFGKLKKEELAAAQSLIDSGKAISKITSDDLINQTRRLKGQQELQSQTSRFSNAMSGIGTALLDMFAPFADFLMPILADIGEVLNNVISPIFRVIGSLVGALLAPFGFIFDILGAILVPASQFVGYIINGIAKPFNAIIKMFNGIGTTLADMGMWFNKYLIEPLTQAYEIGSSIASTLTFGLSGGSEAETGGISSSKIKSVNDAVISPRGDVISTDPDDFLIATKTPETLGGGGVSMNMSGVISELQSLKEAFLSNKDIYMDKEKVTGLVMSTADRSIKNRTNINNS